MVLVVLVLAFWFFICGVDAAHAVVVVCGMAIGGGGIFFGWGVGYIFVVLVLASCRYCLKIAVLC